MNWPDPSTGSWVHEGHVAACREEEFHGAAVPRAAGAAGQQHPTHPRAPHVLQAWHNLLYPKFCLYRSLHTMQPWHRGEQRPWGEFMFGSMQEHTRTSICFIGNILSIACCISWSTPEAQGSEGLFKALCGRGHAPMSQSHLVGFERPDGKDIKCVTS